MCITCALHLLYILTLHLHYYVTLHYTLNQFWCCLSIISTVLITSHNTTHKIWHILSYTIHYTFSYTIPVVFVHRGRKNPWGRVSSADVFGPPGRRCWIHGGQCCDVPGCGRTPRCAETGNFEGTCWMCTSYCIIIFHNTHIYIFFFLTYIHTYIHTYIYICIYIYIYIEREREI